MIGHAARTLFNTWSRSGEPLEKVGIHPVLGWRVVRDAPTVVAKSYACGRVSGIEAAAKQVCPNPSSVA